MKCAMRLFLLSVMGLLGTPTEGSAWVYQAEAFRDNQLQDIAVHSTGDPIAVGYIGGSSSVVRVSSLGGREVWRTDVGSVEALDLVVDAEGDVFVFAETFEDSVAKLSGDSGEILWIHEFRFGPNRIAIDASGNPGIAEWNLQEGFGEFWEIRITSIAATDGSRRWRTALERRRSTPVGSIQDFESDSLGNLVAVGRFLLEDGGFEDVVWRVRARTGELISRDVIELGDRYAWSSLHLDRNGDAIAVARGDSWQLEDRLLKISADGGEVVWHRSIEDIGGVAFDSVGDVYIINGRTSYSSAEAIVTKIHGGTGATLWAESGTPGVLKLGFDGAGEVLVAGLTDAGGRYGIGDRALPGGDLFAAKLDAETGAPQWTRPMLGTNQVVRDRVSAVAVDPSGDLIIGGQLSRCEFKRDFTIVKLNGRDGSHVGPRPPVFSDSDGDGVVDHCDNCTQVPNPPFIGNFLQERMTGGQLDHDQDGFGNACDADVVREDGLVTREDLWEIFASFGGDRRFNECGVSGTRHCAAFDLDGSGSFIGGADLIRAFGLFGRVPGPKCEICPLMAEEDPDYWGFYSY